MDEAELAKKQLRGKAQEIRRGLEPFEPALEALLPLIDALEPHKLVLTWLPARFEPDPTRLKDLSSRGLAVTRTPVDSDVLTLHPLGPEAVLERHRFGFLQPIAGSPEVAGADIGLVLLPGLAFDRSGGRLGHGGGHYDRLLARLPGGIPLVGATHSALLLDGIPMAAHDVRMTHLLTERELLVCG